MANRSKASEKARPRRAGRTGWLLLLAVLVAATGVTAWATLHPRAPREDPNVVVNLTTRVGQQAPAFTLADFEGEPHEITPGDGRPYVLIFHMGSV
jgi:hypothetical protein